MTDTGRAQNRSRRFGHKVYLSDAEEARMYEFSQIRGVPMGRLMREGALKLIDEMEKEG